MIFNFEEIRKKLKIFKSLRIRIFIIIFFTGLFPSLFMFYGILQSYEDRATELRKSDVQAQLKIIANHLIQYNYLQDTSSEVINAELDQLANLYDGRILIINNNLKVIKDTYGISEGKTSIAEEVIQCFKGTNIANYDRANGFIEIATPITETVVTYDLLTDLPESKEIVRGVMLTSVSTNSIHTTMEILSRQALLIEMLMTFFILIMAVVLSNLLTRPFDRISKEISEVKAGFVNNPIKVSDYLETEHIVDAFNELLNKMRILDDSRQEFVSNVSHELKTPITSMKVLADSLLSMDDVPVELYREFLSDIAAEIEREDKIINDLLALVKMDKAAANLNISIVDINALTEIILKRLRPIARKREVELTLESRRAVAAEVDEVKVSQILTNLIENAIKYNKEHGEVKVIVNADHKFFTIEVHDSGIGIPTEDLEQIYERFFRVDKSHSKEIGGTGLGLSIARNAVLLHRGSIQVNSIEGEGTVFTVTIPLNYIGY